MTLVDRALVATIVVLSSSVAHAQSADAEALFRQGRAEIKKGDLAGGCDKLAASERIESSVGTLLNLGDCREKLGKLASAWASFRKAEAMAQRAGTDEKRRAEASRRATAIESKIPNIVVDVAHPVDGLVIRRDDEVVDTATLGTPLPVDAGPVVLTAEAPGYKPWKTTVQIESRDRHRVVEVPPLVAEPKPEEVVQPTATPTYVTRRVDGGTWSSARKVSLALGIAGVGALGTGIGFGIHAKQLQDDANRLCPGTVCADPIGLHDNDRAQRSAHTANLLYISGGAAVATAFVIWLVGGPSDETIVVPTVSDHQVGISLSGRL